MIHQFVCECENVQETQKLAEAVSETAEKGDTFALFGTLGAGKSVFARAFVQHLTGADEVPSPTFTLVQTYQADEFEIFHYDLYRLKSEEEIWELDMQEALYEAVNLIEWPEKMKAYLPRDIFKVSILPVGNKRQIKIEVISDEKAKRLKTIKALKEASCV